MMELAPGITMYPWVKTLHIMTGIILLGTGLGSAFFKYRVDRIGDLSAIVFASKTVVLVDWLFTAPAVVLQPLSGLLLAHLGGYSLTQPWLKTGIGLYLLAGLCWLPAVYLQICMRNLALEATRSNAPLPDRYRHLSRIWFWLGVFGFGAALLTVLIMVVKPF
jgi:uncharacterized membrane protein